MSFSALLRLNTKCQTLCKNTFSDGDDLTINFSNIHIKIGLVSFKVLLNLTVIQLYVNTDAFTCAHKRWSDLTCVIKHWTLQISNANTYKGKYTPNVNNFLKRYKNTLWSILKQNEGVIIFFANHKITLEN